MGSSLKTGPGVEPSHFRNDPKTGLPASDTNGSDPDDVLAAICASFDALSLTAESLGVGAELSLYAVGVSHNDEESGFLYHPSKKPKPMLRAPKLPKPVPVETATAVDEVLVAASHVEHAYSVGGGWSVPLSLSLRRLQQTVRNLRALENIER